MITGWILSGSEQHPLFDEGLPGMEVSACTVTTAMDEVDSAELALPASNKAARSLLHKNSVVEIRDDGMAGVRCDRTFVARRCLSATSPP